MTKPMRILSLGAGVQSSTLALMMKHGEVETVEHAIFADTGDEPKSVYDWLAWLTTQLPFPVHIVCKSGLTLSQEMLRLRERKLPELVCVLCDVPRRFHSELACDGRRQLADQFELRTTRWARTAIPAFVRNPNGSKGMTFRQCTTQYKIEPIQKAVRRLAGIKRGQKTIGVHQQIGISLDEAQRMKDSRVPWIKNEYPLVDAGIARSDCLAWMAVKGYPTPPRSACVFCPYHHDTEWLRLKNQEPEAFAAAVKFELDWQAVKRQTDNMRGIPYLHSSLRQLSQVEFKVKDEKPDQFGNDCAGICGV
jgi:hypothetical protein